MKIVKKTFPNEKELVTYIANDGTQWADEESCLDHEINYENYKIIARNAEIPITLKDFDENIDPDFITDCLEIFGGLNVREVKWFKANNNEETKSILKAHLEYSDWFMEWAENLVYPDYIAVVQGKNGGAGYSYRELLENSRLYIKMYKEYLDYFEAQFAHLNV